MVWSKETNLGLASVTELIENDGQIAETLEHYLLNKGLTEEIKNSLKSFEYWLKEHLVLTKNLLPHNLVLKKGNDELIIKIVDGIGCHSFIPLPQNLNFFAKIYVNKRIKLMWQRIHWDLSGRKECGNNFIREGSFSRHRIWLGVLIFLML